MVEIKNTPIETVVCKLVVCSHKIPGNVMRVAEHKYIKDATLELVSNTDLIAFSDVTVLKLLTRV